MPPKNGSSTWNNRGKSGGSGAGSSNGNSGGSGGTDNAGGGGAGGSCGTRFTSLAAFSAADPELCIQHDKALPKFSGSALENEVEPALTDLLDEDPQHPPRLH